MARFCTNCGNPLEDDAIFCDNCGTRLNAQPNPQPAQPTPQPVPPTPQPVPPTPQPQQPYQQPPQPQYQQPQPQYRQPQYQQPQYQQPQPYAAYHQPGMTPPPVPPTPQAPAQPRKKKTGLIVGLILGFLLLAAAVVVALLLLRPRIPPEDPETTAPSTAAPLTTEQTEVPTTVLTEAPTTAVPTEVPTEVPMTAAPTEPPTEAPPETSKQPSPDLPYFDTLGEIAPTDFAWIADVQGGGLEGSFLSKEEMLGKWKGELIFNGTWELVYLTIDSDGMIYVESMKYNSGDGWHDTEEDGKYFNYDCEFDVNRVYGPGDIGSIDLYEFITSHDVQYGVGEINVNNLHVDVYLVRP